MDLALQVAFLALLLAAPLASRRVEHNLEAFFLVMAVAAAALGGLWSWPLLEEALLHPVAVKQPDGGYLPVGITQAVLAAGLAFYYLRRRLEALAEAMARPAVAAAAMAALAFGSSAISAVVASAIFAELLALARAGHDYKARAAVYGAFAIGAGAALLPLGEPLSAIAVAKLGTGFLGLAEILWDVVAALVLGFSLYAFLQLRKVSAPGAAEVERYEPSLGEVVMRAVRVFAFIFALTVLGEFFKPLAKAVAAFGEAVLYLFGLISAAADNATLVAALVTPEMGPAVRSFLTSLIVSGGLLIPGNVPNIVLASVLKIGFREWAKAAAPPGLAALALAAPYVLLL